MTMEPRPILEGVRCRACDRPFKRTIVRPLEMTEAVADMLAARCPRCGSASLSVGEGRTLADDLPHRQPGAPESTRAANWLLQGETGSSSRAVHALMTGSVPAPSGPPSDLDDVRRCALLIGHVPEWRGRLHETATLPGWERVGPTLDAIVATYEDEAPGMSGRAPRAGALLEEALDR